MDIVSLLLKLAFAGGEWVLYLLILLSIWVTWVIIDRWWFFHSLSKKLTSEVLREFEVQLKRGNIEKLIEWLKDRDDPVFSSIYIGLLNYRNGTEKVIEVAEGAYIPEKEEIEKGLTLLGTLGNNAPFIGLFGTVLGIIKAFADIASSSSTGPQVVMAGIAEALVATAVGLLVAVPAVIAYNAFRREVKKVDNFFERMLKMIQGYLNEEERSG